MAKEEPTDKKIVAVCDTHGAIVSLAKLENVGDVSSGTAGDEVGIECGPNQYVVYITLTPELEKLPVLDLHSGFRVDLKCDPPILVRSEDSKD